MIHPLTRLFTLCLFAGITFVAVPEEAAAGQSCGGLNQSSCWSVNPKNWCKANLRYVPGGVPGKGRCVSRSIKPVSKPCGGLNQSSCWNVNPARWCRGDLQYKPNGKPGQGRCVARAPKASCGGEGQKSCWHVNPARWCNDGMKYKPTGIPGEGRCIKRVSKEDRLEVAGAVARKAKSLGSNNPLESLRQCLKQPRTLASLEQAMKKRSSNDMNRILNQCGASADALRKYGNAVLGTFNSAAGTRAVAHAPGHGKAVAGVANYYNTLGARASTSPSMYLTISGVLGGVAKVGVEGSVGYRIQLRRSPEARFFIAGGVAAGIGLSGGGDVSVGLGYGAMPTGHWARETGASVSYSGKYVYGGGLAVDFGSDSVVPSGVTVSGGVGAGVEAGVLTATLTQYLYNF